MGTVRRAGGVAVALMVAALAVAGCGGGDGGGNGAAPRQSGDPAEAAAKEYKEPDGAQRSGSPSVSPSGTPAKDGTSAPPSLRMTTVSHVMTGGVRGIAELTIDSAGRWKRTGKAAGKVTAGQITTLNRLLGSSSLAQEAKRYAAANPPKGPAACNQPIAQTLRTSKVTLRKSSCDKNFVATPTHDEVVKLLYQYTDS